MVSCLLNSPDHPLYLVHLDSRILRRLYRVNHLRNNFGQDECGSRSFEAGGSVSTLLEQNSLEEDPIHSGSKVLPCATKALLYKDFKRWYKL